jgi:nitroimidazol reductase NimA-like FMN-containing flavoprotein (pyridoxamine 5'-phosphate oxidase superfamily)
MVCITRIDLIIIAIVVFIGLDIVAILTTEDTGVLALIVTGIITVVGYAFVRPPNGTLACIYGGN